MIWNIAHRGGAGLLPENTLAAFAAATRRGCDGAELDVQLSADGAVVVHHDFRLNPGYCRDTAGVWLDAPGPRIKDLTLAALGGFDIGRARPGSDYARAHPGVRAADGERIPTLEAVVALARKTPSFQLLVELKSNASADSADPVALADAALAVVEEADFLDRAIFIGFDWRALARVKEMNARARLWCNTNEDVPGSAQLFETIRRIGGEGWFPHFSQLTSEAAAHARDHGLALAAWTVNEESEMRRLIDLKIDAICTDRPDLLQSLE